eukprot:5468003-Prymnesium_polylepis.2
MLATADDEAAELERSAEARFAENQPEQSRLLSAALERLQPKEHCTKTAGCTRGHRHSGACSGPWSRTAKRKAAAEAQSE